MNSMVHLVVFVLSWCSLVFHRNIEVLNRAIRQDEKIMSLKIKNETFKLGAFDDDLVLILQDPLEGIEFLIEFW